MNLEIFGDEIWFGPWKLGRKPDAMPATQWDDCCADIDAADAEEVERDFEAAVEAREEALKAAVEAREEALEADFAKVVADLEIAKVKAREEELQERIRELEAEAREKAHDDGRADALKECEAAGAKVQAMKRELKRRMGK